MKQKMGNLSDIKTPQKARIQAMPKAQGASYLDLYMRVKEKARLEQEKSVVDKRKEQLESNLQNLELEIETLKEILPQEDKQTRTREKVKKKALKKEWKTMPLDY